MSIAVTCSCGQPLNVKDDFAGRKVSCPSCQRAVEVPDALPTRTTSQASGDEPREVLPADEYRAGGRNPQSRRPPPAKSSSGVGGVNAGVAGGFLMMMIAVVWFIVGLFVGWIYFYPPILFVLGIIAVIKGLVSGGNRSADRERDRTAEADDELDDLLPPPLPRSSDAGGQSTDIQSDRPEPKSPRPAGRDQWPDASRRRSEPNIAKPAKSSAGVYWLIGCGALGVLLLLGLGVLAVIIIIVNSTNSNQTASSSDASSSRFSEEPPPPPAEDLGPKEAQTQLLGATNDPTFRDQAPDNGLLVGFDVGLGQAYGVELVQAIQPRYQTAQGEVLGRKFGTNFAKTVTVQANPGYAVGGINVRAGMVINGFSVVFMRIKGNVLDAKDSYTSAWIGDQTGGNLPVLLGGGGTPIVGVIGKRSGRDVNGLGLLKKL